MKRHLAVVFALGLLAVSAQEKPDLTVPNQKFNYAFGLDTITTFKQQGVEIDVNAFMQGMRDALAGKAALTPDQQKAALKELQDDLNAYADRAWKAAAIKNLKDGQVFLTANAKREGIKIKPVIAPDGSKGELQYKILKSGPAGPSPKKTDTVEVHYIGMQIDGTVVDSSVKRGVPATFGMADVIPAWAEALQMMKVGDRWQLFIPAKLGYGEVAPAHIGPNRALIYEVELLSFFTPKNEAAAGAKKK
jgi:FKBP-type peptidyl-prolyl cis-trans isomerase FklB